MCLAVPGQVLEIHGTDPLLRSAKVSFAGVIKQVSLTCTPEANVGDYVLVHVGVAISTVDPKEAAETYQYLKEMGELDGLDTPPEPVGRASPRAVVHNVGPSLADGPRTQRSGPAASAGPTINQPLSP
jgi:hydrogenase expression/formation protein HypC